MMKTLLIALLALLPAAPADGPAPRGDLARFQGPWKGIGAQDGARPFNIEFKGHEYTATAVDPQGNEVTLEGEIKINDQTTPRKIDWIAKLPDGAEAEPAPGIYRFEGDDLILCLNVPGGPRPTEFDEADNNQFPHVTILKRPKDRAR